MPEDNRPPRAEKYRLPMWSAAAVLLLFGALSALFWFDPIGYGAPLDDIPKLKRANYDPAPVRARKVSNALKFDGMVCTTCHDGSEPLGGNPTKKGVFHDKVVLRHGANDRCFNCHHVQRLDSFVNHDGTPIAFKNVVLLCGKCHGTIYRDWKRGAHGRWTGRWDGKRGGRKGTRCIFCHDPHSPAFKPLTAAPGPHVNPRSREGGKG